MTCILELNDADLTLYQDNTVLHRSPGVALVLNGDVHFGEEALRLSRIHPRQTNQHYFTRLNADPLAVPGTRARNHADLVYLHLKTFKPLIDAEGGAVLLAVPGILSPDQLGVLLGVLQEVGIRVTGFVDAAVAALSTQPVPPQAYHLDVMLQRAVVTTIDAGENLGTAGTVGKTAAQEVPECGLNRLLDAWINIVADRFVRETRFDPLHAAATEQQLFNQIYDWIEGGADSQELVVEIVHAEHTRRVELGRGVLEEKAEQRLRQISDALPRGAHVYLSARSARLPGLRRTLDDLQVNTTVLPADALTRGCLLNLSHIAPDDGQLRLVTRLPSAAQAPADTPAPVPGRRPAPTHALRGHEAWALEGPRAPLPLRREDGQLVLQAEHGVLLNGAPPAGLCVLAPGDRVAVGEREYLIIRVQD
jgi:hypothetical protein